MNFQDLREQLRLELLRRIERGILTGSQIARQTGFQQAHVSNFLNARRALSLEGLDRVLASQSLAIEDLLPLQIAAAQDAHPEAAAGNAIELVPVVAPSVAMDEPRIPRTAAIETLSLAASRLYDNRARSSAPHASWQRFVAIRLGSDQAAAMAPLLTPGAILVLDRHYRSLAQYRPHTPTLYAVRNGKALLIRHLELSDNHLILRPHALDAPVQLLPVPPGESPTQAIIGRVCLIQAEL
ncbi:MAG: hypothetical protein KGK08_04645 [Acidobacteriota bacterium]|nr:hypothetical protein [Acidobacteriota bacterium]